MLSAPPPRDLDMFKFSPTIIITTDSLVAILILLRVFHLI